VLHVVLAHVPADLDLEDLRDLFLDHLCLGEVRPVARAGDRLVHDDLAGVCHLGQVLALCSGLLSLPALLYATRRPVRPRRLGEPLC